MRVDAAKVLRERGSRTGTRIWLVGWLVGGRRGGLCVEILTFHDAQARGGLKVSTWTWKRAESGSVTGDESTAKKSS